MLDQISISNCHQYIQIVCNKKSEIKDIKATIQQVMAIYKNSGIDKVYIDGRDRDAPLSTVEYLQLAMYMSETTSNLIKFSVIIDQAVSSRDFFKAAVTLTGGSISYFNEKESALSWLMSEDTIY